MAQSKGFQDLFDLKIIGFAETCLSSQHLQPLHLLRSFREELASLPMKSSSVENILEFFDTISLSTWLQSSSRSSAGEPKRQAGDSIDPVASELLDFVLVILAAIPAKEPTPAYLQFTVSLFLDSRLFGLLASLRDRTPKWGTLCGILSKLDNSDLDIYGNFSSLSASLRSGQMPVSTVFAASQAMWPHGASLHYFLSCSLTLSLDLPVGGVERWIDQLLSFKRLYLADSSPTQFLEELCLTFSQHYYFSLQNQMPQSLVSNFVLCILPRLFATLGIPLATAVRIFRLPDTKFPAPPFEAALEFDRPASSTLDLADFLLNSSLATSQTALDRVVEGFLALPEVGPSVQPFLNQIKELINTAPHTKVIATKAILRVLTKFFMFTQIFRSLLDIGISILKLGDLIPSLIDALLNAWDFWVDKKQEPAHAAIWDLLFVSLTLHHADPHFVILLRYAVAQRKSPGRILLLALLTERFPTDSPNESVRALTGALFMSTPKTDLVDRETPYSLLHAIVPTLNSISTYYQESKNPQFLDPFFTNLQLLIPHCPYFYPVALSYLETRLIGPETLFAAQFMKKTVCTTPTNTEHIQVLAPSLQKIVVYHPKDFDAAILNKLMLELPRETRSPKSGEFSALVDLVLNSVNSHLEANKAFLVLKRSNLLPTRDLLGLVVEKLTTVPCEGQRPQDFTKRAWKFAEFSACLLDWNCSRNAFNPNLATPHVSCYLKELAIDNILPALAEGTDTMIGAQIAAYFFALLVSHHRMMDDVFARDLGSKITQALNSAKSISPKILLYGLLYNLILALSPPDTSTFAANPSLLALLTQFRST